MKSKEMAEIEVSYKPNFSKDVTITSSQTAFEQLINYYPGNTIAMQEHFVVLYLNRGNAVLGGYLCASGTLTATLADIRVILAIALKTLACKIIISHNHPSRALRPSEADITLTEKVQKACNYMDIELLDHIIVSPEGDGYYSFMDKGMI